MSAEAWHRHRRHAWQINHHCNDGACVSWRRGKDQPPFVVGGDLPATGRLGALRGKRGEHFVVEACEYDRSFHNLRPRIGVVLNIEEDHLDYYKDIGEINASFAHLLFRISIPGAWRSVSAE